MKFEEFVVRVRQRTNLESKDRAKQVIDAVLQTFGEAIPRKEAEDLAAQLPKELQGYLLRHVKTRDISLEQFYTLVANRADIPRSGVVDQVRAVMSVLSEAVTRGELKDILAELPPEFRTLFGEVVRKMPLA